MPFTNRRAVRTAVFQTVFECEFRQETNFQPVFAKQLSNFNFNAQDQKFGVALLNAVFNNLQQLKTEITHLAPEWPIEKIAILDRAILIVGLAELKFLVRLKIPAAVTLNEYIEITKSYGDDSARRFVNGVLHAALKN